MNESTMTQLKIIVERAVRPVRASTSRKGKMREELLAHVVGVFEEEWAKLGDERAAVERTALRFGNPADVTRQLQESVPARDAVRRYWEGRPGEPVWRTAIRFAWVSGTFALVVAIFVLAQCAVKLVGGLPREALILSLCAVLTIPARLSGLVFLTSFMVKALYGPAGRRGSKSRSLLPARGCSFCCGSRPGGCARLRTKPEQRLFAYLLWKQVIRSCDYQRR